MTSIETAAMIDGETLLDREKIKKMGEWGHSRIPVYEGKRTNVIGMLLAKNLLSVDQSAITPLKSLDLRKLPLVVRDTPLYSMLNMFQTGRSRTSLSQHCKVDIMMY
jgi:metal transporter CNNM